MFLLFVIFYILCVFNGISTLDEDDGSGEITLVENINEIVDRVLPDIAQQIKTWNMDPLTIGNFHSRDLSNCSIEGLSTVKRSGDCYFTSANSKYSLLQAHIGFEKITGTCVFTKRVFVFMRRGTIQMRMDDATTFVRIGQEMNPDSHPILEYLDVAVPRSMQLEAFGDPAVQFAVDTLQLFYRFRMRKLVEDVLREKVQLILMGYFKKITLEDINNVIVGQSHLLLFNSSCVDLDLV